jgi:hypothetical protein
MVKFVFSATKVIINKARYVNLVFHHAKLVVQIIMRVAKVAL